MDHVSGSHRDLLLLGKLLSYLGVCPAFQMLLFLLHCSDVVYTNLETKQLYKIVGFFTFSCVSSTHGFTFHMSLLGSKTF